MKGLLAFNLLIVFLIVSACNNKDNKDKNSPILFPSELVNFILFEQNPVFSGTGSDTWDSNIRERGYILQEDGVYKMWYTGFNKDKDPTMHLGYATSDDGIHWTRYPENPVFNEYWTEDVHLVKHEGIYVMVAEGVNDIAHMLTSTNGIDWQRSGNLDIRKENGDSIDPGPYGTPTLWIENGKWYLFYERNDLGIWLAVSKDRDIWTNVQDDPVIEKGPGKYDAEGLALNQIIKHQGRYYAYYHGTPDEDWSTWNSNVAVSDDLVHWIKYKENPILGPGPISNNISSPILIHDGTQYNLYTMHESVRIFYPDYTNNR